MNEEDEQSSSEEVIRVELCGSEPALSATTDSAATPGDDGQAPPAPRPTVVADVDALTIRVYDVIRADPQRATATKIREQLRISATEYHAARDHLLALGVIARRTGRGFDQLADLVHQPAAYVPLTSPAFRRRPGAATERLVFREVTTRPCLNCGTPTVNGARTYFAVCPHHYAPKVAA